MLLFWDQLFAEHTWLKHLFEIILLIFAAGLVRWLMRRWLRVWAGRFDKMLQHYLIVLVNRAITPVLALAVVIISLHLFPLPAEAMKAVNQIIYVSILGVALYYGAKLAQLFLDRWLEGSPGRRALREPARFVTNVVFAVFGTMIVLENLGVRLTAVWTTLGIGSVAVALALQDTLSNFFAGVYLRIDNPIHLDDYIKLESGEEGFVVHRGWRSTRIRTLQNNVVVVPNAKLASTIVTNYSLPESQMSLLVPIKVSYSCDPEHVEQVLVEEATRAAKETPGLLSDPAPFVRFMPGFGDSLLDFTLICRVQSFVDQFLAQHELRKRILNRFREEGIPFPQQEIHVHLSDAHKGEMATKHV